SLGRTEMALRQAVSERSLEQPLGLPAPNLHVIRQWEDAAYELVVHEWHADLQRVRHGQAVGEREDVGGEERPVVEVERSAQSLVGTMLVEVTEPPERRIVRNEGAYARRVEASPHGVVGPAQQGEVTFRRAAVTSAQEPLQPVHAESVARQFGKE